MGLTAAVKVTCHHLDVGNDAMSCERVPTIPDGMVSNHFENGSYKDVNLPTTQGSGFNSGGGC